MKIGAGTNRRAFMLGGAVGLTATHAALFGKGAADFKAAIPTRDGKDDLKLGVASYSLREFSRALAIKDIQELKTPYVSVKEFHLPYRSTPEELEKGRKDFEKAGLIIMSGGTISLQKDNDADIRKYFDYAKTCRMPLMVIAPRHETMSRIEKFVKEYDIRVAIHNHGPEDKHFPTPQSALKMVRDMDPRCGLCIDVGHTARTGVDVVESIREAGTRLFDMHIKDLRSFSDKDSQCIVGEGIMPVAAIFKELKKMNFQGNVALEYEIDSDNPLPGMKSSFAYMRGVLAGLRG